jgi:hypothetical protein
MKNLIFAASMLLFVTTITAQGIQSTQVNGEVGISVGAAHYFGDLNTRAAFNRPKPVFGMYFRKQFGSYLGLKVSGHFAQLGYSDVHSKNVVQRTRNLSFNTNIFELALQGDFHFFKFVPGQPGYQFTPYVTGGIGFFTYDPYAYLANQKYYLRPLNTEGQTKIPGKNPYSTMAICVPFGVGFKYNINNQTNVYFELSHRFTNTDYLDDVSGTYAGAAAFDPLPNGNPSPAFLLQDRSYEITGSPIGIKDRQRGVSNQKDQYIFAEMGISLSLTSYKCPPLLRF